MTVSIQLRSSIRTLSGHADSVSSVSFSPDGKRIASGSSDKTVKLWNAESGQLLKIIYNAGSVSSVCFSPDGKLIASNYIEIDWAMSDVWNNNDRAIKLWNADNGELVKTLSDDDYVTSISFSPDGKRIVSGNNNNSLRLWDIETGKQQLTIFYLRQNEWIVFCSESVITKK